MIEELARATAGVKLLKQENTQLRREVDCWQRRAERAELECEKWKTTAKEWRREWVKRSTKEEKR